MNELVSIITPSYNTANYIQETIECVLAQTYTNWELIIVDDCSSDNTDEIVKAYLTDERIKYFKNEKNCGAAYSRNRALQEAKGKWIAFLDSDDLWNSEKLEKQIAFMQEHNCHFSYTNYTEIDDEGNSLGTLWTGPKRVGKMRMAMFNYMGCLTVMYDKEYVGHVQAGNIKKRNDYALWVKIIKKCDGFLLDECLAKYRVRKNGSIMNRGKNPLRRMKYNYDLWRISEQKNFVESILLTVVNTFFGALKRLQFKQRL